MGQSSSTARNPSDIGYPDYFNPASIVRDPGTRDEDMNHRQLYEQNGEAGTSSSAETDLNSQHESFSNQTNGPPETRQQPIRYSEGGSHSMRSIGEEDASELEGNEREYRSAAITRMAARRQSTMSRLGSRILPNSVIRGLLSSQEETPAEGHAHRHGLVSRTPPRSESTHSSGRFSPFSVLGSRGISRRRSARGQYHIPPRAESSVMVDTAPGPPILDNTTERLAEPSRSSWRRSARLHRVRHSLSTPISHMFGQPSSNVSTLHDESQRLSYGQSMSDRPPSAMDTRLDFGEPLHELDSVEPSIHANATVPSGNPQFVRRLPGLLRARSTRSLRGEEPTPLSRVLQLAAAAIAAQLSGANGPPLPNIQALGNDGLGGSLENFIQSLQSATSAQAQPAASTEGPSISANDGPPPPVNFLRVFRFANADSPAGVNPLGRNNNGFENPAHPSDGMSVDEPADTTEGRTVTLVVVGVRSVQAGSSNGTGSEQGPPAPGGPGLEALLGLPFLPPSTIPRPHEAPGDFGHRTDRRARLHVPRSAGSPGFQVPNLPDLLRHPGTNTSRRLSDVGSRIGLPNFPLSALSESPPGPHPPPSTPAEQGLSAVSSSTSTPSRLPSSASAMSPSILPQLHENRSMQPVIDETVPPPSAARHRRRSDSEYARHRALGSGSVRRNGVVEPDQPPPSGGRSWLIYVVGTNLSENHPALTTPSLFTDNPTYEDMILLSSLLGPAKPPVATQADINSAGGLFRLVEYEGSLVAESVNGASAIHIQDGERCLICLSDYEVAEEVRELVKCKHVFHRDCIDQWLTTGRNSCPLCRGEGVDETPSNDDAAPPDAIPASAPEVTAI
ncbi:hypothetical protein N7466_001661 [Penicillium verhagenii]|uniref:uncharacterized protein n=1 Tax=Penicillium verhagenii TaxID=1562060 RepID=UPI0025454F4F|nr:uncharacterized protein N7466_001661 [Penicillium verhagenii]KAJ5938527.1 hypothetical protein N7466_001661 [Penicillium verhagenii]